MSQALIGLGIAIQLAAAATPNVKTTMAKVSDISAPPIAKYDQIDASTYDQNSPFRQFITGLADPGEFTFTMNYIPNSATDVYLLAARGTAQVVYVTLPDGTPYSFNASITEYGSDKMPIDGKMTATCKCKVSGAVTQGAVSAPVNVNPPSVHGSALTVGTTFTAGNGEWAPSGITYTYQWKRDGTDISGATSKTYTAVSGDATHALSVAVTATNLTGSATATSLKTGNIV